MSFKGNIAREGNANTTMFFIIEDKKKKKRFRFLTKNCESIINLFCTYLLMI